MTDFDSNIGQVRPAYTVENPHPLHGKDPNIVNEFGHTMYPKFLHKFHAEKGHILKLGDKWSDPHDSVIVNDEDEEEEQIANGYSEKWIKPVKAKAEKQAVKPAAWDAGKVK